MTSLPPTSSSPLGSHRIRSVSVVGGFLDGLRLELADGLNCFIGGRGTGKTTVLELVRFALDAFPRHEADPGELRRIESLVEHNLAGGRVQVGFQTKNGLTYVVSRSWGEEPVVLTADGQPTQLTLKSGGVFRADIFSQNEVERIADRTASQLVLIDNFQADAIAEIESRLRQLEHALGANASRIASLEARHMELREEIATLPEVEEELKAFAGSGGEDADAIDQAHANKALRDREQNALDAIDGALSEYQERMQAQCGWLEEQTNAYFTEEMLVGPNGAVLSEFAKGLAVCSDDVDVLLRRIADRLGQARQQREQVNASLESSHNQQELAFRALIEKHEVAMKQATKRANLERLRNDLLRKKRTLDDLTAQIAELRQQRDDILRQVSEVRDKRFSIRQEVANSVNSHVSPTIRVRLRQFGDVSVYQRILVDALKGAGIRHIVVAQRIATALPPRDLSGIVKDRDSHALVDQAGLNAEQADKVIDALHNSQVLFFLEAVELNDEPRIELKDGDDYKNSLSISTGQKCTTILPILLLDSDRPLLVDQPEDNLDNGFIYETVVTRIREVKAHRQLIFVTHNPNIPVLGDAATVFVFKSNGVKAWIEKKGTVDDCRTHIVDLLEGGEQAFKLRQQRYEY